MGVPIFRTGTSWYWLTALLITFYSFFFPFFSLLFNARRVRARVLSQVVF